MENTFTSLAPIILFTYNRPLHTKKTLEALHKNYLANQSILYIYCDGINQDSSIDLKNNNSLVKKVIREKQWCKEVVIIESVVNKGLANSIIEGVTEVINKFGKIIVLEDDLITSKYFLDFMNKALDNYKNVEKVIQISGFSFPSNKIDKNNSSYFLPLTSTWGWATWKRAWELIDFECSDYIILKTDKNLARKFNLNGSYNYMKMLIQQMEQGKISSWGIRFYWNAFKYESIVLYPDYTLISNNGWDNTGRHKDNYDVFPVINWDYNYKVTKYPENIELNTLITKTIFKYIKNRTSFITKFKIKVISVLNKF